ncbi:hypothetical protein QCA50_000848 [Cerrena zonata]|uniref:Uncharacterized protein n=1 Tax=Cerrena zonata TaxID=2478898 RepID=A0AAW0GSH7_9APHY
MSAPSTQESSQKPSSIPLSVQQEDVIIHTRITNDEKALRRVTKKFHNYASMAYRPVIPSSSTTATAASSTNPSVDDAREAFLVELASFHLSLKKSLMVCEAEARQVEEYQRERERIANEHERTKDQLEELKTSLEQAQLDRRRKMEYDVITEKINTLPSRSELESSIRALENDMAAIRAEHETQDRTLIAQKTRLDMLVSDLSELRLMGKPEVTDLSEPEAPPPTTPAPEITVSQSDDVEMSDARERAESGELKENEGTDSDEEDIPLSKTLNPTARPFIPHRTSGTSLSSLPAQSGATTPVLGEGSSKEEGEEEEDVEMGELSEDGHGKGQPKMKSKEDLEEGEASDLSSELSELPDD